MPELRRDPVVGRWVIISTERGKRPSDFGQIQPARRTGFCPFCPGNEGKTPPEVFAIRESATAADSPGWQVRVVSNKFPALQIEGNLNRRAEGIYDKMNGIGAHEVLIETTDHEAEFSELPVEHVALVVRALRERSLDLAKDRRFRYIQIFKNHGEAAGASLEHSHIQLIATPIVPRRVVEELNGCLTHFEHKERCILCDIVDQELDLQKRVVCANESFIAIEPFAPRFPFETWVLPRTHESSFETMGDEQTREFAKVLKESLQRINGALNKPPYNFVIHTAPCNDWKDSRYYHWHVEIMPKLTKVAGFEWGTGFYINPTPPEAAAAYLREVSVDGNGVVAPGAGVALQSVGPVRREEDAGPGTTPAGAEAGSEGAESAAVQSDTAAGAGVAGPGASGAAASPGASDAVTGPGVSDAATSPGASDAAASPGGSDAATGSRAGDAAAGPRAGDAATGSRAGDAAAGPRAGDAAAGPRAGDAAAGAGANTATATATATGNSAGGPAATDAVPGPRAIDTAAGVQASSDAPGEGGSRRAGAVNPGPSPKTEAA